jgi:basic membrane lipoprotein Med (substrate-binding protein (PBP1-ABC) superfamily)
VVVAVGSAQVAAVAQYAGRFARVRFVVLDGRAAGANVTNVDQATRNAVRNTVVEALSAAAPVAG